MEIRNFKLFLSCVESYRTAQLAYEKEKTDSKKAIYEELKKRVDAWINWFHKSEDNTYNTPPFVGKNRNSTKSNLIKSLEKDHTPEEIERFLNRFSRL